MSFRKKLFLVMLAAIPFAAFAEPIARQHGGGSTMFWELSMTNYEEATLTWLCDGDAGSFAFPSGKGVALHISDLGTELRDGTCGWELRLTPIVPKSVAEKLAAARAANDDRAARRILREAGIDPDALVASGAFTISRGEFVSTEGQEDGDKARTVTTNATAGATRPRAPIAADDQVIPDDLIVQGSLCVGFDCVNNENFSFDTIRMKENNLRVHFDDTSTLAGFPANDWRIIANDSASGGASKFSVEDSTGAKTPLTIRSGASTNSIFVDSTGRVGFRTSTPVLDLHVATSNTPAIRLEQNNSGGFTAQTWDIGANEANFFIRDVTGGSKLSFRIRPGAPTSSLDIAADGKVGLGTGSPDSELHIQTAATDDSNITIGNALTGPALNISYNGASLGRSSAALNVPPDASAVAPNPSLRLFTANVQRMIIDNEGFIGLEGVANPTSPIHHNSGAILSAAGVWTNASSRDLKENIHELSLEDAKSALESLTPVTYNYKVAVDDPQVGFIAEDVPALVATPDHKTLSPIEIVGVLTKVVKDQQKTIDELTKKIEELQNDK